MISQREWDKAISRAEAILERIKALGLAPPGSAMEVDLARIKKLVRGQAN